MILALLFIPLFAFADGGMDGGGGSGIVCRNPDDTVKSVRLTDFEDTLQDGESASFNDVSATGDTKKDEKLLDEELQKILGQPELSKATNASFKIMLSHNIQIIREQLNAALLKEDNGTYIFAPMDLGLNRPIRVAKGCKIELIAFFSGWPTSKLDVDSNLWRTLSITGRAGLIVHEAIYGLRRALFQDHDSSTTRQETLALFSQKAIWNNTAYNRFATREDYLPDSAIIKLSVREQDIIALQKAKVSFKAFSWSGKELAKFKFEFSPKKMTNQVLVPRVFADDYWSRLEFLIETPGSFQYGLYLNYRIETASGELLVEGDFLHGTRKGKEYKDDIFKICTIQLDSLSLAYSTCAK